MKILEAFIHANNFICEKTGKTLTGKGFPKYIKSFDFLIRSVIAGST
jgi:hypothetical protein